MTLSASAAEVYSSNTVGYQKINLSQGYNLIGMQFNAIGGAELPLATAVKLDSSMAGFDDNGFFATQLQVWDGSSYVNYGWSGSSGTELFEDSSLDNQWLDKNLETLSTEKIAKAEGVWLNTTSTGVATIAGEVPTDDSVTITLNPGYNVVANPYPRDVKISTFGVLDSSMAGFNEDGFFATQLQVWNGTSYVNYGWSGSSGSDFFGDPTLDNQWVDEGLNALADNVVVPYGSAVWIITNASGTITFTK